MFARYSLRFVLYDEIKESSRVCSEYAKQAMFESGSKVKKQQL